MLPHFGEITHVGATVDQRFLITAGKDGVIFVYKISEYVPSAKRQPVDDLQGVNIESELGKIVLVNKNLMEDWRKQQEVLRNEMEETSNKVVSQKQFNQVSYS